jgi:hypothetical protein
MSVLRTGSFRAHRSGELELRKDYSYRRVNFSETLMRYFLAVTALPIGLGEAPREGVPMPTAGLANRPLPSDPAAVIGAVLLTVVTGPAQEELLPAFGELADDQAERVHGVPGVRATKLAASVGPCEEREPLFLLR